MTFLGLRMLIICWLFSMPAPSRLNAFGWIRSQPKLFFFAWEATWGKILTLDRLQKQGWHLPNRCFLCGCEEENVNHILLHCIVVRALWEIVLALFGANWVFPETIKEMLLNWRGPFVGKKRKKIWNFIPLCIFWTVGRKEID